MLADVGLWDDDADVDGDVDADRAPICPDCGVTALAAEGSDDEASTTFVCENPDCDAFGETVGG